MPSKRFLNATSVFVLSVILPSSFLFAGPCAMCKMGLEQGGSSRLALGFYWSILLIVALPLVILGFSGFYFYRKTKNRLAHLHGSKQNVS